MTANQNLSASGARAIVATLVMLLTVAACGGKGPPSVSINDARLTTIGVNSYLWRAALETMQFMPLAQVDSAGGVIVGDWYHNPAAPGERVRVTVAILDGALRADAVQVAAARQVQQNGQWADAPVRAGTVQRLEEVILQKARDLRQAAYIKD